MIKKNSFNARENQQALISGTRCLSPGAGPALACYHFNWRHWRHKKSCPAAIREPALSTHSGFGFLKIKIQVFLIPETSGFPRAWPIARDTRSGREKHSPAPGCFQSMSPWASCIYSDPVPPLRGSLLQEPLPTEVPACGRKGRHAHTRTLRSPFVEIIGGN